MIERVTTFDVYSHFRVEVRQGGVRQHGPVIDVEAELLPAPKGNTLTGSNTNRRALVGVDASPANPYLLDSMQSGVGTIELASNDRCVAEVQKVSGLSSVLPTDWRVAQQIEMFSRSERASSLQRKPRVGGNLNTYA
jgi:hypothetical protein